MDIKLNRKTKKLLFIGGVFLLIGLMILGLYLLFDRFFNGMLIDWLESNYATRSQSKSTLSPGTQIEVIRPNWAEVKRLVIQLLVAAGVGISLLIILIARFWSKIEVRSKLTDIEKFIEGFMQSGQNTQEDIPKDYANIAIELSKIKSDIQHHEQLLQNEAARKNDLITYLAHDLKTPLTSIIGYLSLLHESPDIPIEQRVKYTGITLNKAQRLEHLINEFFDITRFNLQQVTLSKRPIDLSYMLVQLTDEFYPLLAAHGNHITMHEGEHVTITGDPDKLARVFNNILKNAIAYSFENTAIRINVVPQATTVEITFTNEGPTIPAEKLEQIFEKFFRLDASRSSETGGAGLGLAIARDIITAHDGTLTATSENDETTFLVTLPK